MNAVDLSLYLVTDSTSAILGDADLCHVVDEAIKGGVTVIQYRDKHTETRQLISTANALHEITKSHGVPLLINDRVDVALAIGAEGVHLGQDDMPIAVARKLLGSDAIIGITSTSVDEAKAAQEGGANYIGIGTVMQTPTKEDTGSIIGTAGTAQILKAMAGYKLPMVAIGGINASNVQRVMYQASGSRGPSLNGVAVVSAIVAAKDPQRAARELKELVQSVESNFYPAVRPGTAFINNVPSLLLRVPAIIKEHCKKNPLCHNMTNLVVQNFAANVCLAAGSSPIMSNNGHEAQDLASLGGALVINMGTVTPEGLSNYILAMKAYNVALRPILFDPVGGGATTARKDAVKRLMASGFFDVIKGNEGEVKTVFGSANASQRGVDSGPSASSVQEKAMIVAELARREGSVVLMTGSTDLLSDGDRTVAISNGDSLLGQITGSGCALGSIVASYTAAYREDKFLGAFAAIMHYEIAAEMAAREDDVRGPGTFIPVFLDQLSYIKQQSVAGQDKWFSGAAKVEVIDV